MLGARIDTIRKAEDREAFSHMLTSSASGRSARMAIVERQRIASESGCADASRKAAVRSAAGAAMRARPSAAAHSAKLAR